MNETAKNEVIAFLLKHTTQVRFQRNRLFYVDAGNRFGYVLSGRFHVVLEQFGTGVESDKELILASLEQGAFIGSAGVFSGTFHPVAKVVAVTDSKVAVIGYDRLNELMARHPQWGIKFLKLVGKEVVDRLVSSNTNAYSMAYSTVSHRVMRMLWELARLPSAMTHPDGIQIKVSRVELAKRIGCSREMVGRCLKNLAAEGAIMLPNPRGHTIVLIDRRRRQ